MARDATPTAPQLERAYAERKEPPRARWLGEAKKVEVAGVEPASSGPYYGPSTCVASRLISIGVGRGRPSDLSDVSLTPEMSTRGGDRLHELG